MIYLRTHRSCTRWRNDLIPEQENVASTQIMLEDGVCEFGCLQRKSCEE